jgi:fumarate reductase subunit D
MDLYLLFHSVVMHISAAIIILVYIPLSIPVKLFMWAFVKPLRKEDLRGKVVLIIGASSGIGEVRLLLLIVHPMHELCDRAHRQSIHPAHAHICSFDLLDYTVIAACSLFLKFNIFLFVLFARKKEGAPGNTRISGPYGPKSFVPLGEYKHLLIVIIVNKRCQPK